MRPLARGARRHRSQAACRAGRRYAVSARSSNGPVSAQRRKHALLPFEHVGRDLTEPVREIRAELERLGLDRRAVAFARRGPAREEVIGLRLIVRDLDSEHLEQLAGGIHRARPTWFPTL